MNITLLSPYHGGSHRVWASGYAAYSNHEVDVLSLPARFWKWRMHGGAVTLARRYGRQRRQPDLLLATDMLDLTTFLALTRPFTANIPTALYMHENQLTYPLPADRATGPMRRQHGERDLHYVFINYASMLAADAIFFNSSYHLESWFDALPGYLNRLPEYKELGSVAQLRQKSAVLPVGVDFRPLDEAKPAPRSQNDPPLILWNHRWEYDKNPAAFFEMLYQVQATGIPFRLALCGQQYGKRPSAFAQAGERLANHIVHTGHAPPALYTRLLWEADVVVSTAVHEFFGISMLEAIYCHTFPLLPRRLSYPEIIPEQFHSSCLYDDQADGARRLQWALTNLPEIQALTPRLATAVSAYDWTTIAPQYDAALSNIPGQRPSVRHPA